MTEKSKQNNMLKHHVKCNLQKLCIENRKAVTLGFSADLMRAAIEVCKETPGLHYKFLPCKRLYIWFDDRAIKWFDKKRIKK